MCKAYEKTVMQVSKPFLQLLVGLYLASAVLKFQHHLGEALKNND